MKITRGLVLSLLAPGVVCLLVAVEIAFGLRGFDDPRGGFAAVLEVPGMLVGWGALFFLVPLLVWLVLDWWGVTFSGIALKCLGATAVAIAIGAMFGIVGGVPAGGHLGAGLGTLLSTALGSAVSFALLSIMALPGLVLTCAGFLTLTDGAPAATATGSRARAAQARSKKQKKPKPAKKSKQAPPAQPATSEESEDERPKSSLFRRRKKVSNLADLVRGKRKPKRPAGQPWYPEPQFDDEGNELPMVFGETRDVGSIRFAPVDEDENETVETDGLEDEAEATADALPTIPELFAGSYDPDDLEAKLAAEAEAARAAEDDIAVEGDDVESAPPPAAPSPERGTRARVVEGVGRVVGSAEAHEETLMPGVRWAPTPSEMPAAAAPAPAEVESEADEEEWEDEPEVAASAEAASDGLDDEDEALGRVMGQTPTPPEPDEAHEPTPSVKDSVLQALEGEAHTTSSKRYLQKLEASGIFDFMQDETPEPDPGPKKSTAKKKKAAKKPGKKKTAKRKAAARKKKAPAKRKSTPKPKSEASKPKPVATRKASAVRKPRPQPAVKKRPSAPVETAAPAETPRPKPDQWKTGSWRYGPNGAQPHSEKQPVEAVSEAIRRQVVRERRDPRFTQAAEICLERGAASPVLLTRRMGIGYSEAKSLVERLVGVGVLGAVTPSGSYPTAMTRVQWVEASRP